MNIKAIIAAGIAIAIILLVSVNEDTIFGGQTGYDVGTPPCDLQCNSCSDCIDALNNASVDYVCLNTSISYHAGTCINNPTNFTGKTFDCQGYNIDGNGTGYGVYLDSKENNTIQDCNITSFERGVYLFRSEGNTVNVSSFANNSYGVHLYDNSNNTDIINNNFTNTTINHAIVFSEYCNNNSVINNTIINSAFYGIRVSNSDNNSIINNTINFSSITGINIESSTSTNLTGNSFNSNNNSGISLTSSNNTLINDNYLINHTVAIYISASSNNTVDNATAVNNSYYSS